MPGIITNGSVPISGIVGLRRTMIFIDGRHLLECLVEIFWNDELNYVAFSKAMSTIRLPDYVAPELIRTYFYDAIPEQRAVEETSERTYRENEEAYIQKVRDSFGYQVRLGRYKKDGNGRTKKKGIDTLIALDMISKAYENQYDVAILFARDEELSEAINAVKDAGKRVHGIFIKGHIISELKRNFDNTVILNNESLEGLRK